MSNSSPNTDALAYLATPYSKYENGNLELAFRDAASLAAKLMLAGVKVYSPIAHTHPLAVYGNVDPLDHDIWLPFDEAMMQAADVLIVAHMSGWQASKGIAHEIEFFEKAGKPIFDLDPHTLTMSSRRGPLSPAQTQGLRDLAEAWNLTMVETILRIVLAYLDAKEQA